MIKVLKRLLLSAALLMSLGSYASDFQVIVKPINPFHFGPAEIFSPIVIVNNSKENLSLNIKVEVKSRDGVSLGIYQLAPLTSKPGLNDLQTSSPVLFSVVYYNTGFQNYTIQNGTFPSGQYTFSVLVEQIAGTDPSSQTSSVEFEIEGLSPALPILPEQDAEIELIGTGLIQFSWVPCRPSRPSIKYSLKIVEVHPDQTALDALIRNPAIHEVQGLSVPNYLYPPTAPALQTGKTYAWQLECYEKIDLGEKAGDHNTAVLSDAYKFKLVEKVEVDTIFYATPLENVTSNYVRLNNGELYFTFQSDYLQGLLDYSIKDEKQQDQEVQVNRVEADGKRSEVPIVMKGSNKFVLSFKSTPANGFYLLELRDLKGIKYYLKIKVD